MTLHTRFEVITPLTVQDVTASLSDIALHMAWLSHIMELPKIYSKRKGEGVLIISGGKYPVKIDLEVKEKETESRLTVTFTGTFYMRIHYMIKKETIGTKVRGDIEIKVGFLWERMLKGFAKELSEHLRNRVFNYLKDLEKAPLQTGEKKVQVEEKKISGGEKREEVKEVELPKEFEEIKKVGKLDKLSDPLLLSKLISSSEFKESLDVSSITDFLKVVGKLVKKYPKGKLYIVLRDSVNIRILSEEGVMTGIRIEVGEKTMDGEEAIRYLKSNPEVKGTAYVFLLTEKSNK